MSQNNYIDPSIWLMFFKLLAIDEKYTDVDCNLNDHFNVSWTKIAKLLSYINCIQDIKIEPVFLVRSQISKFQFEIAKDTIGRWI